MICSRQISYVEIGVSLRAGRSQAGRNPSGRRRSLAIRNHLKSRDLAQRYEALFGELPKRSFHREIADRKQKRVLVFVHGYNNEFDDVLHRFAQIEKDLGSARHRRVTGSLGPRRGRKLLAASRRSRERQTIWRSSPSRRCSRLSLKHLQVKEVVVLGVLDREIGWRSRRYA